VPPMPREVSITPVVDGASAQIELSESPGRLQGSICSVGTGRKQAGNPGPWSATKMPYRSRKDNTRHNISTEFRRVPANRGGRR
jgi:hypothetical protein